MSAEAFVLPNNISEWAGGGEGTGRDRGFIDSADSCKECTRPVKQAAGLTTRLPVVDIDAVESRAWSTFGDDSNYAG